MATANGGNGRRRRLSVEELQALLRPTATTQERVRGLLEVGLQTRHLASVTGVSDGAIRTWLAGAVEPRPNASIVLDDLRTTIKLLLDHGLEPERAALWITSRDPERFGDDRPIDVLPKRPSSVLAAAVGQVLGHDDQGEAVEGVEQTQPGRLRRVD